MYIISRAAVLRRIHSRSAVRVLVRAPQTSRQQNFVHAVCMLAGFELIWRNTTGCNQQRHGIETRHIGSAVSQCALRNILYRNSVYTLVRRVCCQPLPYSILRNVVLRSRLTEIGAVGNLNKITDLPNASFLHRSKRNPAVKCKVLPVEGGQRHLPYIVPFGCALRRISLRPFPVGIGVTASACPLNELKTVVGVAEVRQNIAAVLVELQLCVLQLLLKILLRGVHCKRELNYALAVLQLQRRFLHLQLCTCEGDQPGHALFGTHTRIVHRLAVVPEV